MAVPPSGFVGGRARGPRASRSALVESGSHRGDSGRRVLPRLAGVIPGHGLEVNAALRAVRMRIVRAGGIEGSGDEGVAAGTRARRRERE